MKKIKQIYTKCIPNQAGSFMRSFGFRWCDKEFRWVMYVDLDYDLPKDTIVNIKNTFPNSAIYESGKDNDGTIFNLRVDLRY